MSNIPIINPLWFYFIELLSNIKNVGTLVSIFFFGCMIVVCVSNWVDETQTLEEEKKNKKLSKRLGIASAILIGIATLMPSESTCYKMIITSFVTPKNVEYTKGEIVDTIDLIVEKVEEIMDKDK